MVNEIDARPWLVEIAVEPRWGADGEKLIAALARLATEDEAFHVAIDSASGQFLLKGMDEPHLDAKIDILRRVEIIDVILGAPRVAYRETIRRSVEVDYTHRKQTGRTGQFARVILEIEPNEAGRACVFKSRVVGATVPENFVVGVKGALMPPLPKGWSRAFRSSMSR